jgi:ring-1,2-phenylacetyl-CoA epoxidase subunit PaaE
MNYTLKVCEIKKETEDTVTLCFKQPGLKKVKYLAGQYLTLIFRINGRRYIRPYSFSSCPGVDTFLEVTVKRIPNGIVSNHINDRVAIGDSIEVMQPMGDFIYHDDRAHQVVYLWGVGSGITPLFSIAKYLLHTRDNVRVSLIYGNRNHESTIFLKQIEELSERFSSRFSISHFHTRPFISEENPGLVQGRIDQTKANDILKNDSALAASAHYICGPAGLKESVKNALALFSVPAQNIFTEDFELIKDPQQFSDIQTRNITLKFQSQVYDLEVIKGKTILEAALEADIELPYSCQTGNCSTCKGNVVNGESKMIGLTQVREDLENKEILLCCAHPLTDNVYIEI